MKSDLILKAFQNQTETKFIHKKKKTYIYLTFSDIKAIKRNPCIIKYV